MIELKQLVDTLKLNPEQAEKAGEFCTKFNNFLFEFGEYDASIATTLSNYIKYCNSNPEVKLEAFNLLFGHNRAEKLIRAIIKNSPDSMVIEDLIGSIMAEKKVLSGFLPLIVKLIQSTTGHDRYAKYIPSIIKNLCALDNNALYTLNDTAELNPKEQAIKDMILPNIEGKVSLDGTKLSDSDVTLIAEILKSNSRLKSLSLRSCSLNPQHIHMITEALKVNTTLEALYLSDNRLFTPQGRTITYDGVTYIADALEKNKTLKALHISNIIGIFPQEVQILFNGLKNNTGLIELDITGAIVEKECWEAIYDTLSKHPTLKTIKLETTLPESLSLDFAEAVINNHSRSKTLKSSMFTTEHQKLIDTHYAAYTANSVKPIQVEKPQTAKPKQNSTPTKIVGNGAPTPITPSQIEAISRATLTSPLATQSNLSPVIGVVAGVKDQITKAPQPHEKNGYSEAAKAFNTSQYMNTAAEQAEILLNLGISNPQQLSTPSSVQNTPKSATPNRSPSPNQQPSSQIEGKHTRRLSEEGDRAGRNVRARTDSNNMETTPSGPTRK